MSNNNYQDIERYILKEFQNNIKWENKIDFTKNKDVLDAIVETYMYYKARFTQPIDSSKIVGGDRITEYLHKPLPTTMAELYLDRLLLNLCSISEQTSDRNIKGEVEGTDISFNRTAMDNQLNYWTRGSGVYWGDMADCLKGKVAFLKEKLNQKVIAHELSHMSAISTVYGQPGFSDGSQKKEEQTYNSRLEEIGAELTALNTTGIKIPSTKSIQNGNVEMVIAGYNPESSNYAISSFIELVQFAFGPGEFECRRMIDPESYMKELNEKYSIFARKGGTFVGRIYEDFKSITDKKEYSRLSELQSCFMQIGMERITNFNYLSTLDDEREFMSNLGGLLRIEQLLYRCYKDNELQETENIMVFNQAMKKMEQVFNLLKSKKNMFTQFNSFEELKETGLKAIMNSRRKSLGLELLPSEKEKE